MAEHVYPRHERTPPLRRGPHAPIIVRDPTTTEERPCDDSPRRSNGCALLLFAACTNRELGLVARTFVELDVPAGTVLLRGGAAGRSFVVVIDGTAVVRVGERVVARLHAGDFAGELGVLGTRRHSADVVAETDAVVLECTAAELRNLLHEAPGLTRTMLTTLATRLCEASESSSERTMRRRGESLVA